MGEGPLPARKGKKKPASAEIDPSFRPVVDAFAHHRDVTSRKLMSSYGLKVNGKNFAMFGRKQFVAKLPKKPTRDELVDARVGKRSAAGHSRMMNERVNVLGLNWDYFGWQRATS